jgi:hypothetical protein
MSRSKEIIGATLAAALATATPNFELSKVNAQINVPREVDIASLVNCESEKGVKQNTAVVAFNSGTEVYIGDRSNPRNITVLSYDEAGVHVTEKIEGKILGSSVILIPPGNQPEKQRNGENYITSGETSLTVKDKIVNIKGVRLGSDSSVAQIEVFCNPKNKTK